MGGFAVTEAMRKTFAKYDVTPKSIRRLLHATFGQARIQTMAKNLIESFHANEDPINALVVTSNHHRLALERYLIEHERFELISLE